MSSDEIPKKPASPPPPPKSEKPFTERDLGKDSIRRLPFEKGLPGQEDFDPWKRKNDEDL